MARTRAARVWGGALVAALVLVISACESMSPWDGVGPRVAVAGDSLVFHAQNGPGGLDEEDEYHYLTDALNDAGYTASVGGMIGATIAGTVDLVEAGPAPLPDVLVFAAGSNDAHAGIDPDESIHALVQFLDETEIPCVVLVTFGELSSAWSLDVNGPPYNERLRSLAAERDGVELADWAPFIAQHPEWLKDDQVHMTEGGTAAYREFLVESAQQCPGFEPPPTTLPPDTTAPTDTTPDEIPPP